MSRDLRVLLVEDSEDDAALILRALRRGGFAPSHRRVETSGDMAAALAEGGWEIVLSDYRLPHFSGPAALELLKSTGLDLPFIIISGTVGEETAVECMRSGASDFLLKSSLVRLSAALLRELTAAQNRRAQRDGEARTFELERAREQAERESLYKSEFLTTMSHEMRTPLNAILGFSELLIDETVGPLNDKQAEYLGLVLRSGRHLLNLINDFLDLSKIEAGRMAMRLEPCAVEQVIAYVVSTTQPLAQAKQIEMTSSFSGPLPRVAADLGRLKQVLLNLTSNAIKFTPDGGRVTIQGEPAPNGQSGEQVQISVADTGIGIQPEDRERIFEAFEQVDSAYARSQRGTGLGLALSRRLVEMHGGRIWAESEGEGRGSTFRFTLPLCQSLASA